MKFSLPFGKKKPAQKPQQPQPVSPTAGGAEKLGKTPREILAHGSTTLRDIIAPSAIELDFNHIKIGNTYFRTLFVAGYPRYVSANWLEPLINFDHSLNISMFIYPIEGKSVLDELHRKIAEMEAEIQSDIQRGRIVNPDTKAKLEDARTLQEILVKGIERFFEFGLYITIPAKSLQELDEVTKQVISTLGSLLIVAKTTTLEMENGFKSTLPYAVDYFMVTRNMDTTSLATTFPFTSSELTSSEGIMYGINEHNGSLVIFDRFSLENANAVVFATTGAGKSFLVKLEAFRYFMFGTDILIIDPENEYQALCEAVGGEYISFGFNSKARINPFDLSTVKEEGENNLSMKILSLHSLFKIIMGEMTPPQEAVLDHALVLTYKMKGITPDPATQNREPPLMEDLYKTLIGMEEEEARNLAARIEKYVKGSFRGLLDQPSNVTLRNRFTVFSIRDLEDALRPVAMFIVLDYIWTLIRRELKRRILVVDEAWYMMQHPDSANFLYSMTKRARKYYLGMSIISQDVEDFLSSDKGRAIINNSSIQILLKQSSSAIDRVSQVFYLSQGERFLLLSANVGQGLFFAGPDHVAIRIIASPEEYQLITTRPDEILSKRQRVNPQPPSSAPGSAIPPQINQASDSQQADQQQPEQAGIHHLSNYELQQLNNRLKDDAAWRDPRFKQIAKKAFGSDKPPSPSQFAQVAKTVEKEIASRYHAGAWSEALPKFVEPSPKAFERLSDRQIQSALRQAEHDIITQPSKQTDLIQQRIDQLKRVKQQRKEKGKWMLKD